MRFISNIWDALTGVGTPPELVESEHRTIELLLAWAIGVMFGLAIGYVLLEALD